MTYKDVIENKPTIFRLESLTLIDSELRDIVYYSILLAILILIAHFSSVAVKAWVRGSLSKTRVVLLLVAFIALTFSYMFINTRFETYEWEKEYVDRYLEQSGLNEEHTINYLKIITDNYGRVKFVVDETVHTKTAPLKFRDGIDEPYVEYGVVDEDLPYTNYKKGDLHNVTIYLPKDYKLK